MTFLARTAGRVGAVLVASALAAATPAAAWAGGVRVVRVPCSTSALAAAITSANATPAILRLSPFCTYTISTPLPAITGNVTLVGGTSTSLKRDPAVNLRILDVTATGTLKIVGIFVLNGTLTSGIGAGVRNAGTLIMIDSTVANNTTLDTSGAGLDGGGLYNSGRALIVRSLFVANHAITLTGNFNGDGGTIYNDGTLTVVGSRFTGNTANGDGAAINTAAGRLTRISRSTFEGNSAVGGGAIANNGTTSLDRSIVQLNQIIITGNAGGGIYNPAGTVSVRRSIIRRNSPDNCAPAGSVPGVG